VIHVLVSAADSPAVKHLGASVVPSVVLIGVCVCLFARVCLSVCLFVCNCVFISTENSHVHVFDALEQGVVSLRNTSLFETIRSLGLLFFSHSL
jgi:hypothetical protein